MLTPPKLRFCGGAQNVGYEVEYRVHLEGSSMLPDKGAGEIWSWISFENLTEVEYD